MLQAVVSGLAIYLQMLFPPTARVTLLVGLGSFVHGLQCVLLLMVLLMVLLSLMCIEPTNVCVGSKIIAGRSGCTSIGLVENRKELEVGGGGGRKEERERKITRH
jgi:hypothetical protein